MNVKIPHIPPEGLPLEFALDVVGLNARVDQVRKVGDEASRKLQPGYVFQENPIVAAVLTLEGSTVFVNGDAKSEYETVCSRCAEPTKKHLTANFSVVLKPLSQQTDDDECEDVNVGYYENNEVDCASVVEEFLVLALPFTVLCDERCKGLCPQCGTSLNLEKCGCKTREVFNNPLSVLGQLKLH